MWNAANNRLTSLAVAVIATAWAMGLTSCGDKDKEAAIELKTQATEAMEQGRYEEAIALIDSIDHAYPKQIDIRREAMHLRPQVLERLTQRELSRTDSLCAILTYRCDSLKNTMVYVKQPIEGYYTAKCIEGKTPGTASGLYARMTNEGLFYLIASCTQNVKSVGVELSADGATLRSATVEADGELNDRSRGVELITFTPAQSDTLGAFVLAHYPSPIQLTYVADRPLTIKLLPQQAQAIAETYVVAKNLRELGLETRRKAYLGRQLDTARSQQARTFEESPQ
ncbi:MAG: hypothetical protein LIO90_11255 [Bacteroidales bacterium]|nr:hypothetical protein [Bacteroidales bacterium]